MNAEAHPSYKAVCAELDRRRRIALGFERIGALLEALDNPQHSLRVAQVVGTNGKGTTAIALASALCAAGHPSGAYLSPHVLSYTERVMLRGRYSTEKEFAGAMWKAIEVADENDIPATQFELLTAGALALFRDSGFEWAILEAGLGARHDATSAAEPEVVVLTNVGLDHTEYLGETVEEIAEEKLASIKSEALLVLGTDDPRVLRVAREATNEVGARLVEHKATGKEEAEGASFLDRNEGLGLLAGEVALKRTLGPEERNGAVAAARAARPPARFEEHEVRGVLVVVDGGHNPEGLRAALGEVRTRYGARPLGVVFGVLKGKDVASMLRTLENEAQLLVLTRPDSDDGRALDPEWVQKAYGPRNAGGRRARVIREAEEALCTAVEEMREAGGVVLVTGSLSTGAGILELLRGDGRD
ncbi:MAG: Dihydrofolate synthase @ Folylpolyglutamate synthase [uncultured Rubrobacteraceae bacterium]|uniref:tetrahydrofolate synthase n=1 Tax=uncultured Rubrobacteraceae bacterium TaxID=349277 RepID=A0A6J4R0R3_9ACTN|nr:MAG: Dihydrofolate synthase @ Folylpolyglutamate synthase [uncultured Rubrobacteraceae bacterium]